MPINNSMIDVRILLFDGFETLDAMGPAEVFGRLPERYRVRCFSQRGGLVTSSQGVAVQTEAPVGQWRSGEQQGGERSALAGGVDVAEPALRYLLLVPGGQGARALVEDSAFIDRLGVQAEHAWQVLCVCTGSALLARTGLLDGLAATTNKRAFDWVASVRPQVGWRRSARWVRSGHIYTSSGISAGMDMTLGFIADHDGAELARAVADRMEYVWNEDNDNDPFAIGEG